MDNQGTNGAHLIYGLPTEPDVPAALKYEHVEGPMGPPALRYIHEEGPMGPPALRYVHVEGPMGPGAQPALKYVHIEGPTETNRLIVPHLVYGVPVGHF